MFSLNINCTLFCRMAMEEDIDSMKVKASQDAASIHELRIAVEQEKEGYYYFL